MARMTVCRACGSRFQVTKGRLAYSTAYSRTGAYSVIDAECPECGNRTPPLHAGEEQTWEAIYAGRVV